MAIRIEAASRLGAQALHKQLIGDQAGMKRCKAYTKDFDKQPKQFTSLGAKDGIEMFLFKDLPFQTIVMVDDKTVVAYLELVRVRDSSNSEWYEMLSQEYYVIAELFIAPAYRGKKLATVLHLGAMHTMKHLVSDINMAVGALVSFKSLEKYGYKIGIINSSEKKKVDFEWGSDGVPEIDGKSMESYKDIFILYTK